MPVMEGCQKILRNPQRFRLLCTDNSVFHQCFEAMQPLLFSSELRLRIYQRTHCLALSVCCLRPGGDWKCMQMFLLSVASFTSFQCVHGQ